jgi:carboxyl-terminal processing protease
VDIVGWTLDPVVELIRGPAGSAVRLQVLPKGADAGQPPHVVSLVRDRIDLREQTPRMSCDPESGLVLCVIAVPRFYIDYAAAGRGGAGYPGTAADVARLLNERRERPPDGIVLDLRGNSGGALLEAVRLAGLFIDAGPIVQVKHAEGEIEEFADPVPGVVYAGPLLVLLDRYSASATEIFAAAVQDYGRGSVVGEHSYGKGTVQETFDLNDTEAAAATFGQLVLTTAEYFRVTGRSTQLSGVALDLALPPWPRAGDYGERFEANPLAPGRLPPVRLERVTGAVLIDDTVRALHAERLRGDAALRSVLAAAAGFARPGRGTVSLNEAKRRRELERQLRDERALAGALRAATASGPGGEPGAVPAEQLWSELVLAEARRVLADVVRAARGAPVPARSRGEPESES